MWTEDNYLFRNQVLQIATPNLTIRILKNDTNLSALCYFSLPSLCDEDDVIEIAENLSLHAKALRFPLFTIKFDIYDDISFNSLFDSNLIDIYIEARSALLDIIKWKEYWFNM